jgi:hypothetical protein
MGHKTDTSKVDEIRAMLCKLGKWPDDWGESTQPMLLDLYDLLEASYRAAGRPFGDSLEGLVRWWREEGVSHQHA